MDRESNALMKPIKAQEILKTMDYTTNKEFNDKLKSILERK
jgi:hypothetical protein